jgi:hypothetical protein
MKAFDVATGRELPLIAAGGQNLIAAGGQNLIAAGGQNLIAAGGQNLLTDAAGRFDYVLPTTSASQLVKLVAQRDGVTLVSLFDGAGNVVGEPPALGYRLKQVGVALTVRVKLTAATTAAAKVFEGAFKLQFQLKETVTKAGLENLFARVNRAVRAIEASFRAEPALAQRIASSLDARGELTSSQPFQAAIEEAGLLDSLLGEVKAVLETFTAQESEQEKKAGLDVISNEDFPLGRVVIETSGEFSFTAPDGSVVKGAVENTNLVAEVSPSPQATTTSPTPAPDSTPVVNNRRRDPTPTPEPTAEATGTIDLRTDTETPGPPAMAPRVPDEQG